MAKITKGCIGCLAVIAGGIMLLAVFINIFLTSTTDLSNQEPYKSDVYKDYVLIEDMYLIYCDGFLGLTSFVFDPTVPKETSNKYVGLTINNNQILAVIPRGTIMRLEKVERYATIGHSYVKFLMRIKDGENEKKLVDARFLAEGKWEGKIGDINAHTKYRLSEKYIKPVER
ncbi:MAG: hypothetical protein NZM04_08135 [Methylacidiphilales bacterium]|nr:hypothetical protein [Candidatus Methylacidiphilales bacterium]